MKTTEQIGIRITAAVREYCRYTGPSADLEKRGAGASRAESAWVQRYKEQALVQEQSSPCEEQATASGNPR